jgi:cytochrome P450 / NADPH-cytochrome P450 reductase
MYLLLNPSTFFAAQQEVDRVLGTRRIEPHTLNELPYINAVLRETLRLSPTAPGFARGVRPENKEEKVTVAGGKYEIPRGAAVVCLLGKIQRDPKVWGDNADQFRPERMLDENFAKLPKNAWRPFGTGLRACIGRAFAWQEALLVTALLLQNFNISLADPNYKMQVQQTLTIKPKNTYVHVKLRPGINATQLLQRLTSSTATPPEPASGLSLRTDGTNGTNGTGGGTATPNGPTLAILYGSNTGTCQSLAQSLAVEAGQHGYTATVHDLDTAVEHVAKGPNMTSVIITASYEGQPPDNAARFVAWLERVEDKDAFAGTRFAVFGCGHVDWASTYQRIPTLVDSLLEEHGATRVVERGVSDASQRDMFGDFAKWTENVLWKALPSAKDAAAAANGDDKKARLPTMDLEISTEQRATHLQQKLFWAKVTATQQLTAPGQPEKRHIEFQLPSDMTYRTGDYLAVLPLNLDADVRRVIQRFRLPWDAVVTIKKGGPTTLPTDSPIALAELLRGYVELALPATRKDIEVLRELAEHGEAGEQSRAEAKRLGTLLDDAALFTTTVLEHRTSLLDLLEQNPSVELPLASFLVMLPPLRARHYSIASSPLASPDSCALCYSVIDEPTWDHGPDGTPPRKFRGITGTYLKSLQVGDQALVAVRATNQFFRLPVDPEATPLLMFCAGSGFAPFRGFLQERAVQIRDGNRKLAPAVLFVGCRIPNADRLYADEVDAWVRDGVVDVRYAFSKDPNNPQAAGCRYVPERLLHDKDVVVAQWKAGAKVYTCGSGQVAKDLGAAARKLILERAREQAGEGEVVAATEEEAAAWMQQRHNERFVTDIFT